MGRIQANTMTMGTCPKCGEKDTGNFYNVFEERFRPTGEEIDRRDYWHFCKNCGQIYCHYCGYGADDGIELYPLTPGTLTKDMAEALENWMKTWNTTRIDY
ncbi:hypothetical protein HYY75_08360 [bacterium]|nr:hypothetical protein [bacterium]